MTPTLSGVLPVLHMPYRDDYEIDFEVLRREVDFAYECGAQGIVFALASELLRLTGEERRRVAEVLVEAGDGRGSVTISVGAESTYEAVQRAKHAQSAGASAVMAVPPLLVVAGEGELRRYYAAILGAISLPVVVQDASSFVGKPMTTQFQASLWQEHGERVLFKPEAAPVGPLISALKKATNGGAQILEGSGGGALPENYRRGIAGTMSGTDLLDGIVALWNALEASDDDRVDQISSLISSILALAVGLDGYLAIEKYLLHKRGLFPNTLVRGPVGFALDEPMQRELDRLFERLQGVLCSEGF